MEGENIAQRLLLPNDSLFSSQGQGSCGYDTLKHTTVPDVAFQLLMCYSNTSPPIFLISEPGCEDDSRAE